ncbi:MAG: pyrroline-5-carboxylate reductase [Pseudomonadota bacterium]
MSKSERITLIGAGRMGSALAGGWLKAGYSGHVDIVEPHPSAEIEAWVQSADVRLNPEAKAADILVVAVKPQVFGDLADQIAGHVGETTQVLSIMAGVSMETLAAKLGTDKIARAMPNTPGLIGRGVTILCLPDPADAALERRLRALLEPLGAVEGPISEALLPAATAVSGCGPAYGFLLAEVMAAAGAKHGLDPDMAMRLARRTVEGAGALMATSPEPAATLRKNVTSPNGVTQAALEVLMHEEAMPSVFIDALRAAIDRDRELASETE